MFDTRLLTENQVKMITNTTDSQIPDWVENSGLPTYMSRWFEQARDEAFKSNFHSAKLGCVLVYKNHILSVGHNQQKTDPIQQRYNRRYRKFTRSGNFYTNCGHNIHAEMDAIKNVSYPVAQQVDWKRVDLYVYRIGVGLNNYTGLALPCQACAHALSDIGIRKVYYTTGHADKPFGQCDI